MSKLYLLASILLFNFSANGQVNTDSINNLPAVVVSAFEQNRKITDVAASIHHITNKQLNQFNNTSILPVVNNLPGLRMEERSPGSYRLNIRGSSLRSPFGVRNVKVYVNNIPFTDPSGGTYLNQFSFYNIQSLDVIKGPSGSLYGAGNGGVLLLKTEHTTTQGFGINLSMGSFGLQNYHANLLIGNKQSSNRFSYTKLKSDGYRAQTNLQRDIFTWDGQYQINEKSKINTLFLLGDLYYQTPGGLNETEYIANPKQARPRVGTQPSAAEAKAAIYQQTFFSGFSHNYQFAKKLENTTTIYGAFSKIQNPSIRNYERRTEPHLGTRSVFAFTPTLLHGTLKIVAGTELQTGAFTSKVYKNKNGLSDSLQTEDELTPKNLSIFTQIDYAKNNWIFTIGTSINYNKISITRLSKFPLTTQSRTYKNELAPRLSVLRKIGNQLSIFASVAKGFSPPTTSEVLPSTSIISTNLNAENGWNYESGARWQATSNFYLDITTFYLKLHNTIVIRRDISGADYFVNAGSTDQKGIEFSSKYQIKTSRNSFLHNPTLWANFTYHNFKYKNFKQASTDLSGKQLPGVPQQTINAGLNVQLHKSFYANTTFNYVSPIKLNDANTFTTAEYYLLAIRLGFRKKIASKLLIDFFAAGDNLLNQKYSLGNDINAVGNRFYNAAPTRNFSIGLNLFLDFIDKNKVNCIFP